MPAAQVDAEPEIKDYIFDGYEGQQYEDDGYDWTGWVYCEEDGLWYDGNEDYEVDADWCYDPNA